MKNSAKKKILDAALEVFSQKGYRASTVREICKKAGVNIALINYHFSSKRGLYGELIGGIVAEITEKYPVSAYVQAGMNRDEKLRGVITLMVMRAFGSDGLGKTRLRLQLINREMVEPSEAMRNGMLSRIQEVKAAASGIVLEYIPDAEESTADMFVVSIISQCLYPVFAREVIKAAQFSCGLTDDNFHDKMIEHIYQLTRAGLLAQNGAKK